MTAVLPLRVMVEEVWNEVMLELPASTPVGEIKRQALAASRVTRDPGNTWSSFGAPSCPTNRAPRQSGDWYLTAPLSYCLAAAARCASR